MKTQWDYSDLAEAYLKRAAYSETALDGMLKIAGVKRGDPVCDVGAGVGHLTIPLSARGLKVVAVEPNDAMRALGQKRTQGSAVPWFEGTGENTGQGDAAFKLVTFGSSFNVTDRQQALKETKRILQKGGWFAAMWNHRDLDDPIQKRIESIIKDNVDGYDYGSRREDQTAEIEKSGIFGEVRFLEGSVKHQQDVADAIEAWRSHATLQRQAGDRFSGVVGKIAEYLESLGTASITVPYTTRIWISQVR